MDRKFLFILLPVLLILTSSTSEEDGWVIFSRVKFSERKINEELYLVPLFDTKIRAHEGTLITLKGHYIPFDLDDKKALIISRVPNSNCFFCGGAGPESVAEVHLSTKAPKLKADQIIKIRGRLELNDKDVNHMNFILKDAQFLPL